MADIRLDSPLILNPPTGLAAMVQGFASGREQYPPGGIWVDAGPKRAVVQQQGATGGGPTRAGRMQGFFDQEFLHRLWFDPNSSLDFGAITGRQSQLVPVWNSYLTYPGVTVSSVSRVGLPDDVSWDDTVPRVWRRLEYRPASVVAEAIGAAQISGKFEFVIDGQARLASLTVSGVRALLFGWGHNWQVFPEETAAWLTRLLISEDGTEQAIRHRHHPRRTYRHNFTTAYARSPELNAQSLARFNAVTRAMHGRNFVVPMWFDAQRLTADVAAGATTINLDTVGRDFEPGAYVVLLTDPLNGESVRIESVSDTAITLAGQVQSNWSAGKTIIAPGRLAALLERQSVDEVTGEVVTGLFVWELNTPTPTTKRVGVYSGPTYRGLPVWNWKPQMPENQNPRRIIERRIYINDDGAGLRETLLPTPSTAEGFESSHAVVGRAQMKSFFGWLWQQAGAWQSAWVSTWAKDLFPAADMPNDTDLIITEYGEATLLANVQNRKDVEIVTTSGTVYRRRISTRVYNGNGTSTLTLDSGLGVTLTASQIARISYLRLAHGADTVSWRWVRTDALIAKLEFTELTQV